MERVFPGPIAVSGAVTRFNATGPGSKTRSGQPVTRPPKARPTRLLISADAPLNRPNFANPPTRSDVSVVSSANVPPDASATPLG